VTFKPWEIPTGGKPPELRLVYTHDPGTGLRIVLNQSAWMLLIRKADGTHQPLPRTAGWLAPGDEVLLPPASHVEPVDPETVRCARIEGTAAYEFERNARLEASDPAGTGFAEESTVTHRWWLHRRELPHERVLWLEPGAYGNALLRVGLNDGINIEGNWWFSDHDAAWRSVLGWNGEGDPLDGWVRHLESNRRRKDGTAATEYWNAAEAPRGRR
jgi:hypothetical protein